MFPTLFKGAGFFIFSLMWLDEQTEWVDPAADWTFNFKMFLKCLNVIIIIIIGVVVVVIINLVLVVNIFILVCQTLT